MQKADGMNYAPKGKPNPVCKSGDFRFAAIGLDHGHIYGMCNGLLEAGAEIVSVYDADPKKIAQLCTTFPGVRQAVTEEEILEDPSIQMVVSAAVPADRCSLGLRVLDYGKDYFVDKPPLTTLDQLADAREKARATGKKYAVYYSERLHVESAVYAGDLVKAGAIGRVVQVIGLGPHRINMKSRPNWFFQKERYGGILCDIGSHQIEQFLHYAGVEEARVVHSKVANFHHKDYPEFEDFGDASLVGDNGAAHYFRVDWFTPDGLGVWGDGRTIILGTDGYIELRKYIDIGHNPEGDHVYLVDHQSEQHIPVHGKVGYPFFGQLVLDCLNRTENAMTQAHTFKAAELCILAQMQAERIE